MIKLIIYALTILITAIALYASGMIMGWYGNPDDPGTISQVRLQPALIAERSSTQKTAAIEVGRAEPKQILFGDLHVHTSYSLDAFLFSLPFLQGEGRHPPADACDFARYCSSLDFWSINDHAEALYSELWENTRESIRQCNAVAGDPKNPDVVAFLGWEWTQGGTNPSNHYGHKNVILRDTEDDSTPLRPIASLPPEGDGLLEVFSLPISARLLLPLSNWPERQSYYDFTTYTFNQHEDALCPADVPVRKLPEDCREATKTPPELFDKLDEWGFPYMVIPHGTTWGLYTPTGYSLDTSVKKSRFDPSKEPLVEIYSGHGNSEEYRPWRSAEFHGEGQYSCTEPTEDYTPGCWQAGEIIYTRCMKENLGAAECDQRRHKAEQDFLLSPPVYWGESVPGASADDWLESGQCQDCFLPSYNYRPAGSVQYGLAVGNFDDPENPRRYQYGFIGSSDNHYARPGPGYKEVGRLGFAEAGVGYDSAFFEGMLSSQEEPLAKSQIADTTGFPSAERNSSYLYTGGLVAVHSAGRSRDAIWDALERKEVYATSGPRILLWFDLLNTGTPMGGQASLNDTPRFRVNAVGALHQKPGCPDYSKDALGPDRLKLLCHNECYNPSDERHLITRIEVVKITPQEYEDENIDQLIHDAWKILDCPDDPDGCVVEFSDPDFSRDTVYYVRAIQEPTDAVNGGNLRCEEDENGQCIDTNPCRGGYHTAKDDECLAPVEERAWSSPIFIDHTGR